MDEVENVFAELDSLLSEFRTFLNTDSTIQDIKTAVEALAQIVPPVADILDRLRTVFVVLRTEIQQIDITNIPAVDVEQITEFAGRVRDTLETARSLVPSQGDTIDSVVESADLIASLPELTEDLKNSILDSLDDIINLLEPS